MTKKRAFLLLGAVVLMAALSSCDAVNLIGLSRATPTFTKTPRPTFTSVPTMTATPEETLTPIPTLTPQGPTVPPTSTRRPVVPVTPRPATPKPPTPVPAPSFSVALSDGYLCEQPGSPVWKITARINKTDSSFFLGGYILGAFTSDGRFLKASEPSAPDEYTTMTLNGNCRVTNRYRSNAELDVTELRGSIPLIIRVIKSKSDPSPLSPGFKADFPQPGHYYLQFNAAQ